MTWNHKQVWHHTLPPSLPVLSTKDNDWARVFQEMQIFWTLFISFMVCTPRSTQNSKLSHVGPYSVTVCGRSSTTAAVRGINTAFINAAPCDATRTDAFLNVWVSSQTGESTTTSHPSLNTLSVVRRIASKFKPPVCIDEDTNVSNTYTSAINLNFP